MTSSIAIRYTHIYESLRIIKENFLFGIGPGQYLNFFCNGIKRHFGWQHPHNIFLHVFAELGFVGFFLFFYPIKVFLTKFKENLIERRFINYFFFFSFQLTLIVALLKGSYYVDNMNFALFSGCSVSFLTSEENRSKQTN